MFSKDVGNEWAFVDATVIPKQNDVSMQVSQKCSEELSHMFGLEVVLLKTHIEPHVFPGRGDRQSCQSRDTIVSVAIEHNRCIPLGPPSSVAGRDEQKSALVNEHEVGTKFCAPFFLLKAT